MNLEQTTLPIIFKEVNPDNPQLLSEVKKLFVSSFPEYERHSFSSLFSVKRHNFLAALNDGKVVGMLFTLENDEFLYVLYLAVHPDMRGSGIGTTLLDKARKLASGRPVILDIEKPYAEHSEFTQRKLRKHFYEKNGFADSGMGAAPWHGDVYITMIEKSQTICRSQYNALLSRSGLE